MLHVSLLYIYMYLSLFVSISPFQSGLENIDMVLVGNKIDLEDAREVPMQLAQEVRHISLYICQCLHKHTYVGYTCMCM